MKHLVNCVRLQWDRDMNKDSLSGSETTLPLKSKLPVASRFLRDENRVARYEIIIARYENRVASLKRQSLAQIIDDTSSEKPT